MEQWWGEVHQMDSDSTVISMPQTPGCCTGTALAGLTMVQFVLFHKEIHLWPSMGSSVEAPPLLPHGFMAQNLPLHWVQRFPCLLSRASGWHPQGKVSWKCPQTLEFCLGPQPLGRLSTWLWRADVMGQCRETEMTEWGPLLVPSFAPDLCQQLLNAEAKGWQSIYTL